MIQDKSLSSRLLDVFVHLTMLFVLAITLLPIIHIVAVSLSDPSEILRGHVSLWPKQFNLRAYFTILNDRVVPRSFLNSVLITALGTFINIVMTTMMAYVISKPEIPFRRLVIGFILVTMFFSGGLIPSFLLVHSLGMYDTIWALVIPGAISSYYLIIMHSFFKSFPAELEDAAKIDGCNDLQTLWKIVLPLSKAAIATISLFYAVGHWNSYFGAYIYLSNKDLFPLQLILREIILQSTMAETLARQGMAELANEVSSKFSLTPESIQYSTLVISIIPMLIIYPFVQRYFVQGVMIGSLKG